MPTLVTIDAEADGLVGSGGAGTTQTYTLASVAGSPVQIQYVFEGIAPNPGSPAVNGTAFSHTQFQCGGTGGSNIKNRLTVSCISGHLLDEIKIRVGGITSPQENIENLSVGGSVEVTPSPSNDGRILFSGLGGVSFVSLDYDSNSTGNNSFYSLADDIVIYIPDVITPKILLLNSRRN